MLSAHRFSCVAVRRRSFGYTLGMELILKLVAGLMAGLRGYFLIVAGIAVVPCILFLVVLVVRLFKPSRTGASDGKKS